MDREALTATWHALIAADAKRARGHLPRPVIDRGLERAFSLNLAQQPVQRGEMLQLPWWDEHSGEGWVVLGYPPASTYARLIGC
ncbi:hypothetical protein [Blastococcus montanus]|uniref:hypothetical protein n=1 Tax=Blastococcus montanus TaxID=3144973 RepID=UPI00320AA49C